jgi:hypothetical protein
MENLIEKGGDSDAAFAAGIMSSVMLPYTAAKR